MQISCFDIKTYVKCTRINWVAKMPMDILKNIKYICIFKIINSYKSILSITNDVFVECQLWYFFKKCIKNINTLCAARYRYLLMSSGVLFELCRQWEVHSFIHSFIHLFTSMLSRLVTVDLSKFIQVEYNLIFNKHTLGTTINI